MRKLSKKISMLMVLAMLVGLFSGVVSASAASAWSFASGKYDVAVNGSINMESKEYADFDLLKDGKAPAGYTVAWASSDEDVVWVNAKTGQLRANKFGKAADGDKAVISATFTNTATKKSATRSFTIVLGAAKADFTVEAADVTIALGEEVKFAPVVKDAAGNVVKFATHKSYNGYFLDGKAIANPWTPEEAGEYTVTVAQFAKKADVADLAKAVRKDEVKVTVTVDADFDAKATGIKEITVYGNFAADAKFAVKKGNQNISFTATVAADGKSAVLALQNKLYEGTYTVSCGDAKVDLAIEDEKVVSIVIFEKDSQIFTNEEKTEAYAHYDVLNQYGESVRKSFDVTWNSSTAGGVEPYPADGILVIKKNAGSDTNTFNYNDPIVLTGVASGYGYATSETASMTIGLEDSASTVKVLGVIKSGTTELLDEIPASFIGGTYQLVFEMYNRAGYKKSFNAMTAGEDFTFTSLNPLLVKEVLSGTYTSDVDKSGVIDADEKFSNIGSVTIDGETYGTANLVPGNQDQIKAGGVAEIRIVSTKTGVSTSYNLRVVSEQILKTFKVSQPDVVVAKNNSYNGGAEVELKFDATDAEGAAITDFRALYKAVSFSTSDVTLREQNDGTAKLFYAVPGNATPTKQNDYPVVFSVIVPGSGQTDNVKFSVKYDRVASAPMKYNGAVEVLEGSKLKLFLRDHNTWDRDGGIDWADQYDEIINTAALFDDRYVAIKVLDGGLTVIPGEWEDKKDDVVIASGTNATSVDLEKVPSLKGYTIIDPKTKTDVIYLKADNSATTSAKNVSVEFMLYDAGEEKIVGGSDVVLTFKIVDLSQCVGFEVGIDDNYVQNGSKDVKYSLKGILSNGNKVTIPNSISYATIGNAVVSYTTSISGYTLNKESGDVWGHKLSTADKFKPNFDITETADQVLGKDPEGKDIIGTEGNAALFFDLSKFKADGKNADRAIKLDVTAKIDVVTAVSGGSISGVSLRDYASSSYEVANHGNYQVAIGTKGYVSGNFNWTNGNTEACVNAKNGIITFEDLIACVDYKEDAYKDKAYNNSGIKVTISNLREGTKGLREGNISLGLNAIDNSGQLERAVTNAAGEIQYNEDGTVKKEKYTPMLYGAEIGDTFTVTLDSGAKHVIKITVGADQTARFSNTNDTLTYR